MTREDSFEAAVRADYAIGQILDAAQIWAAGVVSIEVEERNSTRFRSS
jgi:hypothetical protein